MRSVCTFAQESALSFFLFLPLCLFCFVRLFFFSPRRHLVPFGSSRRRGLALRFSRDVCPVARLRSHRPESVFKGKEKVRATCKQKKKRTRRLRASATLSNSPPPLKFPAFLFRVSEGGDFRARRPPSRAWRRGQGAQRE